MNKYFAKSKAKFAAYSKDESGATAIEYGLIAAIVAIGCIVAFQALSDQISAAFTSIANTMTGAVNRSVTASGVTGTGTGGTTTP